jgi:hypothetical protein
MDAPWSKYKKEGERGLTAGVIMLILTVLGYLIVAWLMEMTATLI